MTPDKFTIQEFFLDVGDKHQIYVQEWGNKDAKDPIFFLHGGPGAGSSNRYKNLFDPYKQRVIFHDQRGSGNSKPYLSVRNNNTNKLVDDISKIAQYLEIKTFTIAGGSWGSTLGLAYAIKHPKNIKKLILWGTFTGSTEERNWLFNGEFQHAYPDVWEQYLEKTPKEYRDNPTNYHLKQILEGNAKEMKYSSYAYENMEYSLIKIDERIQLQSYEEYEPGAIKIEAYYARNKHFLEENYILENANKLSMPIYLIQGRYDLICPPIGAYKLHKSLSNSQIIWTMAGHSSNDRSNYDVIKTLISVQSEN